MDSPPSLTFSKCCEEAKEKVQSQGQEESAEGAKGQDVACAEEQMTAYPGIHSERTTNPTSCPVNESELADHLGVSDPKEAALLNRYIVTATTTLQSLCARSFVNEVWTYVLDGQFPDMPYSLPHAPLVTIDSFKYYDLSDTEYDFDHANNLNLDLPRARFWLKEGQSWPSGIRAIASYKIVATTGYGTNLEDVPEELRTAIKFIVGWLWEHREAGSTMSMNEALNDPNVHQLISPYSRLIV